MSTPQLSPQELVADSDPLLGRVGSAFYFVPETLARGKEIGLGGLRYYFLGRGGVLGDVEAPVVQSAFGYFAGPLVARMWDSSRELTSLSPREVGRRYVEDSREFGRRHFAAVGGLGDFCSAAERVVASVDPAGLALYAGLAAEPLAEDEPARAMQLVTVLRELRGSAHLLAVIVSGLEPRIAHYLRRPGDYATFGYPEDALPEVTDGHRAALGAADALTDRLMAQAYGALTGAERAALAAAVEAMAAALDTPAA